MTFRDKLEHDRRKLAVAGAAVALSSTLLLTLPAHAKEACAADEARQHAVQDAWLEGKVETVYTLNRHLNPFTIDSEVNCGHLILEGSVETDIDRDLAEELAIGIDGIASVDNQLTLEQKRDQRPSTVDRVQNSAQQFAKRVEDATTTAIVKSRLLWNDHVPAMKINVDTQAGIITLSGEVPSDEVRDLAEEIAENTRGVKDVNNRLSVQNS